MRQPHDTREKMIAAAADLFRRQGYHATAFSEIVAESGAPRGSIYFHFPGGKEELAVAAVALGAEEIRQVIDQARARSDDAASFVRAVGRVIGDELKKSDYRRGCAIATMVLELAPQIEAVRGELDQSYRAACNQLAAEFARYGYGYARAQALGTLVMSTIEGALILSRAARSLEPMRSSIEALVASLEPPASAG